MSPMDPFSADGLPSLDTTSDTPPPTDLFNEVGFCVSGSVNSKLLKFLETGGAKQRTYAGVGVTHFIAAPDADEIKVEEGKDIFEIPIVAPRWITYSLLLHRVLPIHGFNGESKQLFSSVIATVSGARGEELKNLWANLTYYGGTFSKALTENCTHLITNTCDGQKYEGAMQRGIPIVCFDWVTESVTKKKLEDVKPYHPSLLLTSKCSPSKPEPEDTPVDSIIIKQEQDIKQEHAKKQQHIVKLELDDRPESIVKAEGVVTQPVHSPALSLSATPSQPLAFRPTMQIAVRPTTSAQQWTQHQQAEIIRQIQSDPHIKQQWVQMDHQQRTLLIQKLAQRNREDHLRREMLIRQQQMNLQSNAAAQRHQLNLPTSNQASGSQASGPSSLSTTMHSGAQLATSLAQCNPVLSTPISTNHNSPQLIPSPSFVGQLNAKSSGQELPASTLNQITNFDNRQPARQFPQVANSLNPQLASGQQANIQLLQTRPILRQVSAPLGKQFSPQTYTTSLPSNSQVEDGNPDQSAFKSQLSEPGQPPHKPTNEPSLPTVVKSEPQSFGQPSTSPNQGVQVSSHNTFSPHVSADVDAGAQVLASQGDGPLRTEKIFTTLQRIHSPGGQIQQLKFFQTQGQDSQHQKSSGGLAPSTQGVPEMIRTQVFTPQFAQNQQRINVRHVFVHQGDQPPRLQQQHIILQQQSPTQDGSQQQKLTVLPVQPQVQASTSQQWSNAAIRSPRDPNSTSPGTPTRPLASDVTSIAQQWTSPARHQSPGSVIYTTSQHSLPFVQVVNSRTKTALANLLSNRLQGSNGPEPTTLVPTSSPQQVQCPSTPPISQIHHAVSPPSTIVTSQQNLSERRALSNMNNGKPLQLNNSSPLAPPQSLPLVPSRAQFYGHDPSIKLPADGFLLGCVFWAAQPMQVEDWDKCVEQYGGEVEKAYCPRLTHVLCTTQKFPEFHQALRDGKRLITLHWLSDICVRKCVVSPFYALHLPVPLTGNDRPLDGELLAVTGFSQEDQIRIYQMCSTLGATVTKYFTRNNMALIAHKPEGLKYQKAREWKKPVVNVQFLNELMFGQNVSNQMIHSPKYQHFNLEQPFRCDIGLVSQLMAAWKIPIRLGNDCFEKYRYNRKRALENKEDSEYAKQVKLFHSDYLCQPVEDGYTAEPCPHPVPVVAMTGFPPAYKEKLKEKIELLGGKVAEDINCASHLVTKPTCRSRRFFAAVSRLSYIVTTQWICDSLKERKFLDASKYILVDTIEEFPDVVLEDFLKLPDRRSLFAGLTFHLTPTIEPSRADMREIIESAGGQVDTSQHSLKSMRTLSEATKKYIIITCPEDLNLLKNFKNEKEGGRPGYFCVTDVFAAIFNQRNIFI